MPVRALGQGPAKSTARGAWTSWSRPSGSARVWARCSSARGIATWARRSAWGCPTSSYRLFQKMHWPDVGPVPCLVKPLSRRALPPRRTGRWRSIDWCRPSRCRGGARGADAAAARRSAADPAVRRVVHAPVGARWRRTSTSPSTRRRRTCKWKYVYAAARALRDRGALSRRRGARATSSIATCSEPRGSVTLLVDFLADPEMRPALLDAAALGRPRGARRRTPTRSARSPCTKDSASCCEVRLLP